MNSNISALGFNREYLDPILDSYHLGNGYRAYNPNIMQFSAPDDMSPFGKGGINSYMYCNGDPVNNTDPTGHFHVSWMDGILLAGGVVALAAGGISIAVIISSAAAFGSAGAGVAAENTTGATSEVFKATSNALGFVNPEDEEVTVVRELEEFKNESPIIEDISLSKSDYYDGRDGLPTRREEVATAPPIPSRPQPSSSRTAAPQLNPTRHVTFDRDMRDSLDVTDVHATNNPVKRIIKALDNQANKSFLDRNTMVVKRLVFDDVRKVNINQYEVNQALFKLSEEQQQHLTTASRLTTSPDGNWWVVRGHAEGSKLIRGVRSLFRF